MYNIIYDSENNGITAGAKNLLYSKEIEKAQRELTKFVYTHYHNSVESIAEELLDKCSMLIFSIPRETSENISTQTVETKERLIKGIKMIGHVIGCGATKTQEILNNGFLKQYDLGYYLGRTPILELEKWDKLPQNLKEKALSTSKKKG